MRDKTLKTPLILKYLVFYSISENKLFCSIYNFMRLVPIAHYGRQTENWT